MVNTPDPPRYQSLPGLDLWARSAPASPLAEGRIAERSSASSWRSASGSSVATLAYIAPPWRDGRRPQRQVISPARRGPGAERTARRRPPAGATWLLALRERRPAPLPITRGAAARDTPHGLALAQAGARHGSGRSCHDRRHAAGFMPLGDWNLARRPDDPRAAGIAAADARRALVSQAVPRISCRGASRTSAVTRRPRRQRWPAAGPLYSAPPARRRAGPPLWF